MVVSVEVTITYPKLRKKIINEHRIKSIFFWSFLLIGLACGIVNLCVGGKAWSVVVIWSLRLIWSCTITRPLVENHWMGRTTHFIVSICALLVLIDVLLAPGWAGFVVPIIGFGLLIALAAIFFSNLPRRRQNVLVMFWVSLAGIAAFLCAVFGWISLNWPMIVLGSVAPSMLIASIAVLRRQFFIELGKRFHI